MGAIYKVGDRVHILNDYLENTESCDYTCYFPKSILNNLHGAEIVITAVYEDSLAHKGLLTIDHVSYCGVPSRRNVPKYAFSAEMFQETWSNRDLVEKVLHNIRQNLYNMSYGTNAYLRLCRIYKGIKNNKYSSILTPSIF